MCVCCEQIDSCVGTIGMQAVFGIQCTCGKSGSSRYGTAPNRALDAIGQSGQSSQYGQSGSATFGSFVHINTHQYTSIHIRKVAVLPKIARTVKSSSRVVLNGALHDPVICHHNKTLPNAINLTPNGLGSSTRPARIRMQGFAIRN